MNTPNRPSIAIAVAILLLARSAFSQMTEAPQPPRGLFGTSRSDSNARDRLNMLFDASEALDSSLPPELRSRVALADPQSGGLSTMLRASLDYARERRRTQFDGSVLTSFRYYPRLDQVSAASHSARLRATVSLPQHGKLQVAQSVAYSPSYLYGLFPLDAPAVLADASPTTPEYRIDATESYAYATGIGLTVGSPRRTMVTASADYDHVDSRRQLGTLPGLTTYGAGAKVSRALSRSTRWSVEYRYRTGEFWFAERTKEQRLAFGAEYSYALSSKRHATIRGSVAPARLEVPETAVVAIAGQDVLTAGDTRLNRVEAEASGEYEFMPHWQATAAYRRGIEYLPVLTQPVFSDSVRAELTGVIRRRLDVAAAAGSATGASALQPSAQNLESYTGTIRIRYALQRSFAVYTEYFYYNYQLRGQALLAPGLPSAFEQHRVRVGLMLFVDALNW